MKTFLRVLLILAVLVVLALFVPSSVPIVIAEDTSAYPVYTPVSLEADSVEPIAYDAETPYSPNRSAFSSDNWNYTDASIVVRSEKMRAYHTDILLTWVQIADPTQMRARLANPYPSKKPMVVPAMAKTVDAVLAINGDYFSYNSQGWIVRNGTTYRRRTNTSYDQLVIDRSGDLHIVQYATDEQMEAFGDSIMHSYNFGPGLVVNGEKPDHKTLYKWRGCSPTKRTQRICFAQMDTLSYLIVATEGPENKNSKGLTIDEFAQLLYDLGAKQAYNLDGGSSSTVVMNNKKINSLSTGKTRSVGDCLYFITAVPE